MSAEVMIMKTLFYFMILQIYLY